MNRRTFLKTLTAVGASTVLSRALASDYTITSRPSGFRETREAIEARAVLLDQVQYVRPAILPKVINVFLYGGPSELAGNLTNIADINFYSQNPYPATLQPNVSGSVYTRNGFWGNAGGNMMESMLAAGDLSVYRTINRVRDDNKAHGRSITQNLVGNVDVGSPGIARTLAGVLAAHGAFGARDLNTLFLPFVSFEGQSRIYSEGDIPIPIPSAVMPIALDPDLAGNPYQRAASSFLPADSVDDAALETLAANVTAAYGARYTEMSRSLVNRAKLDQYVLTQFNRTAVDAALPAGVIYANTRVGRVLKAAVSLALMNPDTLFISINGAGPAWDDHNAALTRYPVRMNDLMSALSAAMAHLRASNRNDIIINVYGDFGRNVNLNDTLGWDHGNNQNFYTLGGAGIAGRQLGKLVGRTQRIGTAYANRQYTSPTADSYQCEPFAIAASLFKYFGIQNPEVLTGGVSSIDEITPPNLRVV
jgi:hypothetical protein